MQVSENIIRLYSNASSFKGKEMGKNANVQNEFWLEKEKKITKILNVFFCCIYEIRMRPGHLLLLAFFPVAFTLPCIY